MWRKRYFGAAALGIVFVGLSGILIYQYLRLYITEVQPRKLFQQRIQTRVTATELQAWAMECLKHWDTNSSYSPQPITNIHPAVRGLWIHGPTAVMYMATEHDTEHVMVYYGAGGSGHWGLEIGPTHRPLPASGQARRYIAWAPGICFFDGQ